MNYFPWHIGDYAAHTGHLEPMEDLIYRRLLDAYYLREGPLPADVPTTAKLIRLRSIAADVEAILREFFTLTDAGWQHTRCAEEIAKMQDKQAKAREAAQLSVKSRKAAAERALAMDAADAERTLHSESTNAQLPTPTPTPREEKEKPPIPPKGVGTVHGFPPGFERFWEAYPRKIGKDKAAHAFAKRKPNAAMLAAILAAVEDQKRSEQWRKDGGQFIPHPTTWLNEGRWMDEVETIGGELDDMFRRGGT